MRASESAQSADGSCGAEGFAIAVARLDGVSAFRVNTREICTAVHSPGWTLECGRVCSIANKATDWVQHYLLVENNLFAGLVESYCKD